ncbi:hypothetical protein HPB48_017334 [Haemaphysalis longicornis]|uniref:Uncharacterized protein n=1 Tax=Haemaphysalis longicornis TaxID=44386 RepID=A0A9J6H1F3_HAELO|nr:hypothetical protein HPB48_017334 [Haemaphysalis longicornis]
MKQVDGNAELGQLAAGRQASRGAGPQRVGGRQHGGLLQSDQHPVRHGDRVLQPRAPACGPKHEYN